MRGVKVRQEEAVGLLGKDEYREVRRRKEGENEGKQEKSKGGWGRSRGWRVWQYV